MNKKNKTQKGSIMILNVLLFLVISLAILFSLSIPITSTTINSRANLDIKKSFIIANSGAEEALYKINRDKIITEEESLHILDGKLEISITERRRPGPPTSPGQPAIPGIPDWLFVRDLVRVNSEYNDSTHEFSVTALHEEGPQFNFDL